MRKIALLLFGVLLATTSLLAQNRTITGRVTDEKGTPISGASITVRGSNIGTTSSASGEFSITVPNKTKTLEFSYIGLGLKEIKITGDLMAVTLDKNDKTLQEVVVVAYGSSKKPAITGAISTVKSEDLENKPFSSVDKALQGQIPGLLSLASSGQPGSNQQIRIRGIGSFSASSSPLWVIDGVVQNTGDGSRLTTTANFLSTLNPNDIESISVLKDAASAAIYGSRAANGVILVTTKKGKSGKTKIRFDVEAGQSKIAYVNSIYKPLNSQQFFDMTRDGLINGGFAATASAADAIMGANFGFGNGVDFDWLNATLQTGSQIQYNLSASGGSDKTTFTLSAGYFKQVGASIKSDLERYTFAARVDNKVSDNVNVHFNLSTGYNQQNTPLAGGAFGNPVLSSYFILPSRNPYKADGSLNYGTTDFPNGALYNTIATAELDKRLLKQFNVRAALGGEYNILDNLVFSSNYGIDLNILEEDQYNNPFYGDGFAANGRAFSYYTRIFNWTWTNLLTYTQKLNAEGDFNFKVKLGNEAQLSQTYSNSVQSQDYPPTSSLTLPANGAKPITASANGTDYSFNSIFALGELNYKDKYVVTASIRRDGSSRFGVNNPFGNFWSVGGAWNVDREAFLEKTTWIDQLKLRGSYGLSGNAEGIGNYASLATYGTGFNYNQQPGISPSNAGNPDLTWELSKQLDLGIDIGFLKNRLTLSFDYYDRQSEGALLSAPASRTSGFASVTKNIGGIQNTGIEVSLNIVPIKTKDIQWDVNLNLSQNTNKIVSLVDGSDIANGVFLWRPGYDYQSYFVRQWAGVDPANGDPLWYLDSSRTTTTNNYNAAQRVLYGSGSPRQFGAITNTITFKGFTISAQFNYSFGSTFRDTWGSFYTSSGANGTFNKVARQLDYWKKAGDVTTYPKYVYNGNKNAQGFSTLYLFNGDYVRLREVEIAYQFQKSLLAKLHLNSLRFYVRGINLMTWVTDPNLPFDPEQGVTSNTNLEGPINKSFTAGINIGF